ncbi:hypothetical protein [Actinoplanes aureus]|uniref:Uncharacterized protein n=1 Tax=Actinoplanes aureus TaxID=2792083 RepID=A0A931FZB0_9ACTN|nr:hypothetical protein [Actinoplanes aureus]MBG0564567.1 hypothetical protein [Actinoplanes aureus]
MHNLQLALDGAWKVLLASLILGAGLPALFALGVRSMAYGTGGEVSGGSPHRTGTIVGYVCFGIVLLGVLLGLTYIVATGLGKTLSFENVIPTLVDKS